MVSYGWEQQLVAPSPARRLIHRYLGTYDIGALVRNGAVVAALREQRAPASILDAGCGRGQLCFQLHRRWPNARVHGIDFETALVALCRDLAARLHAPPSVTFERRVLPDDPIAGAYGLVTCVDVLEHIDDDAGFLRSLHAATAPGGTLVLHTPAVPQRRYLAEYEHQHDHVREGYTREDLQRLLEHAGYAHVSVRYTFGLFGALGWELMELSKRGNLFASLLLPLAYAFAWIDGRTRPRTGNGLLAVAVRAV
jgi:SAM-dependent methyltransferase